MLWRTPPEKELSADEKNLRIRKLEHQLAKEKMRSECLEKIYVRDDRTFRTVSRSASHHIPARELSAHAETSGRGIIASPSWRQLFVVRLFLPQLHPFPAQMSGKA
jgi:hypothetical protein